MRKPLCSIPLFLLMTFILAGCGESGSSNNNGATPVTNSGQTISTKTAVLKLLTSGSPDSQIAGIDVTLKLPSGASVSSGKDQMVASGVCPSNALFAANYIPSTSTVRLGLISITPFAPGEFATLTFQLDDGKTFTADDFMVTASDIVTAAGTQQSVTVTKTLTMQ